MNRFAKVVDGKIVGSANSELEHDPRRDEQGNLIWRRIVEHIPEYDPMEQMLGERFMAVSEEIVVESYRVIPLEDAPTIEERLDALEAGDMNRIEHHRKVIEALRQSGKKV